MDWRKLPDDLGTFDVVAASDVLDERPQAALVAAVLARTIAPGGVGLVSDLSRRSAKVSAKETRPVRRVYRPLRRRKSGSQGEARRSPPLIGC